MSSLVLIGSCSVVALIGISAGIFFTKKKKNAPSEAPETPQPTETLEEKVTALASKPKPTAPPKPAATPVQSKPKPKPATPSALPVAEPIIAEPIIATEVVEKPLPATPAVEALSAEVPDLSDLEDLPSLDELMMPNSLEDLEIPASLDDFTEDAELAAAFESLGPEVTEEPSTLPKSLDELSFQHSGPVEIQHTSPAVVIDEAPAKELAENVREMLQQKSFTDIEALKTFLAEKHSAPVE